MPNPTLEVKHLTKEFRIASEKSLFAKTFPAVTDVSFSIFQGETFGIVGESGCGKSTVAKVIMGLEKPNQGEIWLEGRRIDSLSQRELRAIRPKFQMVFQDSGSSLNPRKTVRDILIEPMRYHHIGGQQKLDARVDELLSMVGLPVEMKFRYPHEFSGGQRQRICIAKALSLNPDVLVLDEPVSALDVSVQAQILNLLRELQQKLHVTYLFIGHGLGAVRYISHRIGVMYMGRMVEVGSADHVFDHPAHPYTRALLDAAPVINPEERNRERLTLSGEIDTPSPSGACPLYPRCPFAEEACLHFSHELASIPGEEGHAAVCMKARKDL